MDSACSFQVSRSSSLEIAAVVQRLFGCVLFPFFLASPELPVLLFFNSGALFPALKAAANLLGPRLAIAHTGPFRCHQLVINSSCTSEVHCTHGDPPPALLVATSLSSCRTYTHISPQSLFSGRRPVFRWRLAVYYFLDFSVLTLLCTAKVN